MINEKEKTRTTPLPAVPTHLHETTFLSSKEINEFLDALDHNKDGKISIKEIETELDNVYAKLVPKPLPHHLNHASRSDEDRHTFLRSTIGCSTDQITREEFQTRLESLQIPSLKQEKADEAADKAYMASLPTWRRFRSWYSVNGSKLLFLALVLSMMLAFGIWQMVKYITTSPYRSAFGWGVVVAKTSAGMLYPTMFFLILSMSRWFSTLCRQSSALTRIINFDLSQSFHIKISILALGLATIHAIGHLTGSFVFGSMNSREAAVAEVLGEGSVPRTYVDFVRTRPGWTGLTALGLFWLLAGMSMPRIRKWNYEVFQLAHLLMVSYIPYGHGD
jgi:dual oxidase